MFRNGDEVHGAISLCWDCNKAFTKGCSWAKNFVPVEGWTAERRDIRTNGRTGTESYKVSACPQFDPYISLKELHEKGLI